MGNSLNLDEASAAEIIGVDRPTVFGWCKNGIINCHDAPDEYAEKTKYLISEDECNYLSGLIKKFGARKALLNYNKNWRKTSYTGPDIKDIDLSIPVYDESYETVPFRKSRVSGEEIKKDSLISSILSAHALKGEIVQLQDRLAKLETEYMKLKDEIVAQL